MSKIDVYRVHLNYDKFIPLALGNITATVKKYQPELLDILNFQTAWLTNPVIVKNKTKIESFSKPAIFLMSDYAWNLQTHIEFSKALKAVNPDHIIIHGGHDVPCQNSNFLHDHESVDFAVHGEGELTCMDLLNQICTDKNYQKVKGISFRNENNVIMTDNKDTIEDISIVPSPYLTNEFDALLPEYEFAIIETNRGCPYKCAFCSWGFYMRKITKRDINKVFDEIEWIVKHKIPGIYIADANFGIFDRDIEIAEYVCKMKEQFGFPKVVLNNYSNNKENIIKIIKLFTKAKIFSSLVVSIQTTDEETLRNIQRKPHPKDYFQALMDEYIKYQLPVKTQIMIGLPGSSYESLKNDIDFALERKMSLHLLPTIILTNTAMADLDYQKQYGIVAENFRSIDYKENWKLIVSTYSFSREDYRRIILYCAWTYLAVSYRTLKYLIYFISVEKQMRQVDVLEILFEIVQKENNYPIIQKIINQLKKKVSDFFDQNIYMVLRRMPLEAFVNIENTNKLDDFYLEIKDIIQMHFGLDVKMIDNVILIHKCILPYTLNPLSEIQLDYDFVSYYFQDIPKITKKSLKEYKKPITFSAKDTKSLIKNLSLLEVGYHYLVDNFELDSPLWRTESE
ncbi:MAG: radical SAM protein [Desulfobacterales bacterium]|nr:radical SAM protein [Desulfobacterales bacterium]